TCADAQISGAGCSGNCGTVSNAQTEKITVDNTSNSSLTIESGGSVNVSNSEAINFSNDSSIQTFKNQGIVQGGSNTASIQIGNKDNNGATITTFENSGTIGNGSSKYGILIYGNGTKSSIENFKNTGTISSNEGESVFASNASIDTFENSGIINSAKHNGLSISSSSTIKNLINTGTISSSNEGKGIYINNGATINTFENTGLITSEKNIGLQLDGGSTIETFKNSGTIAGSQSNAGIKIGSTEYAATITSFTNETNGIIGGENSIFGIVFTGKGQNKGEKNGNTNSTITNFENKGIVSSLNDSVFIKNTDISTFKNQGLISSKNLGMNITEGATISTFENAGTIDSENGIGIYLQKKSTIENFKNNGTISGNQNNAAIWVESQNGGVKITSFINETNGIIGGENSLYGVALTGSSSNKSTLTNFENKGTISSLKDGIFAKNSSIDTLTNEGTINSSLSNAIILREGTTIKKFENKGLIESNADGSYGVDITSGVSIENFENSGTIGNEKSLGIKIKGSNNNKTEIQTFKNSGLLTGGAEGLNITHATVNSLTNDTDGIIHSKNWSGIAIYDGANITTFENKGTISSDKSYGFLISQGYNEKTSTIENFTNEGLIKGYNGIRIDGEATIETLTNKGTIESNSNSIYAGAVSLVSLKDPINTGETAGQSLIKTFINETDGKIISASNGIMVETGNKIGTFINKGLVQAELNGISFYEVEDSGDLIDVGKICLKDNGQIIAGKNGINIDGTDKEVKVEGIEVESDAMIKGGNAAIYIGGGKIINSNINIKGTLIGGNGGIINEGTIGGGNSGNGGITIENGGSIAGGIVNQGSGVISGNITNNGNKELEISNGEGATINGGIVNSGGGNLVITNQGSVGKDGKCTIKNDSGNVVIKDWVVSTGSDGKLETVVVGGSDKDKVNVDKITVDQGNLNLDQLDNLQDLITGVDQDKIASVGTNGSGEISLTIGADGKLQKKINLKAGAAGAFFRTNHSLNTQRTNFINNVMGNAMNQFSFSNS
ncbi:beta strand repeat-containing protein, partial [Campylobacter sp. 2457A]|uniref:beta strand repeat-containing protein n=1 Tax=Campylobacter sp. 2457A TaxID=2735784 RepID=UPI00301CB1D5|nr:hypothetical protein [Campylobacter sp. 2457A]